MDFNLFFVAIYKTLIYSLWQGTLLVILAGLIMLFERFFKPSQKYILLSSLLALFLIGVGLTFYLQLDSNVYTRDFVSISKFSTSAPNDVIGPYIDKVYGFYDYYLAHFERIFVLIWFSILGVKIAVMVVNSLTLNRLRGSRTICDNPNIGRILKSIGDKLRLKSQIKAFESKIAKTPMVVGILNPIILIPEWLLTELSDQQVEIIMAHELAHVKRKDFLVNLIQSIVEMIFFFNPFVLWISSLIKKERELCCDDIAIELGGNKRVYANTLVFVQEKKQKVPAYGLSFVGNRHVLLKRIEHILGLRKSSLSYFDSFFLGACMISFLIYMSLFKFSSNSEYNNVAMYFSSFVIPQAPENPDRINSENIINQLIDIRVISDSNNFSLKVTNFALYVNGIRQSKALHRQILKDYVKDYNHRLHYTYVKR